jgi:hypothetical protein
MWGAHEIIKMTFFGHIFIIYRINLSKQRFVLFFYHSSRCNWAAERRICLENNISKHYEIRFYPSIVKASRGKPMKIKCDVSVLAPAA